MSKHQITATLYSDPMRPPFIPFVSDELDEEYFSVYNATRRMSELEYLGYVDIIFIDSKDRAEYQRVIS
ncbi:MAG: hypothetical protein JKX96_07730 [Acinetobacter sp.]|nr:hypothetical protein [Acinetobacter sp.]